MKILEVVQKKALHILGGYDFNARVAHIHFYNKIPMFNAYIKFLAQNLFQAANKNRNDYIRGLGHTARVHRQRSLTSIIILGRYLRNICVP